MLICKRAVVTGRVQGVGFRASTQREASRIGGLSGHVRNLPNGDVEIIVQGAPEKVEALLTWARRGPPSAQVIDLKLEDLSVAEGLAPFDIQK